MKILHVVASLDPRAGGVTRAVLDACCSMRDHGVTVAVATTHIHDPPETSGDIVVYSFRRLYAPSHISVDLLGWLWNHVDDYDVVHIHGVFSLLSLMTAFMCRHRGIAYIISVHGQLYDWCVRHRHYVLKRLFLMVTGSRLFSQAARVHLTTREEYDKAVVTLDTDTAVIMPNILDLHVPRITHDTYEGFFPSLRNKRTILFLARLHPKKGLDVLLNAMPHLCAECDDVVLVIAGEGATDYTAALRRHVTGLGIAAQVIFTGFVSADRKYALLQHCDIFILPSYSENCGIAVLEAMASGTAVIVSDQVSIAEDIHEYDAGAVCSVDSDSVAQSLETLLADRRLRVRYRRNARRMIEAVFNKDDAVRDYIQMYKEVISDA